MRLVGRGCGAIRATHAKTLEFTADRDITERATCVVAVDVSGATEPLAGPVRITISAASESFTFEARANSSWDPTGAAVIRRSPMQLPGTLATSATAAASDLPRSLVAALRDPDVRVEISLEPIRGRPCAVLFAVDAHRMHDARLLAEIAAADHTVAEDDDVARQLGERVGHGPVTVDKRVLVVAARQLPGSTVLDALRTVDIETVGLPPWLAAAAASPSRGRLLIAPGGADPRELLRDASAGTRIVIGTPADRLPALLRLAEDLRGAHGAVLVQPFTAPVRIEPGQCPALPGKADVHVCFDAAPGISALDPRIGAAIDGLLGDGVATKTAANALAELTGWPRRRAYDAIVARRPPVR